MRQRYVLKPVHALPCLDFAGTFVHENSVYSFVKEASSLQLATIPRAPPQALTMAGTVLHSSRSCLAGSRHHSGSKRAAILLPGARPAFLQRQSRVCATADQDSDTAITGEWPVNWSLASYEDVGEFFQEQMFKDTAAPGTTLKDVMATALTTVTAEEKKEDIKGLFKDVRPPVALLLCFKPLRKAAHTQRQVCGQAQSC